MTNPLNKLGPIHSRMLKLVGFDKLQIPISSGSDPVVVDSIDDCTEVYGDNDDQDEFGNVVELCFRSPNGQCQYDWRDKWKACIHCGRKDGPGI